VKLESAGTWAATVVVQRGSKAIATKRLSVDVAGGM
jgi:hypothetical protein